MRILTIIFSILLITVMLYSQTPPDSLWVKTFGGNEAETAHSVVQTADGGFVLVGSTQSFGSGSDDFLLLKTDSNGDSLWSRTFGGSISDIPYSLTLTNDDGFAIAGQTNSYGAGWGDFWLIRTDSNGDSLWTQTFSGIGDDHCKSLVSTTDGGFILAGWTVVYGSSNTTDVMLVKTNTNGDSLWTRYYGGIGKDYCYSIEETSDQGFILTGWSDSFGAPNNELYLIRTNSTGDTLWTRTFSNSIRGNSVKETQNGHFIITGESENGHFYLLKTDSNGNEMWSNSYGSGEGFSITETIDGGYIVCGDEHQTGTGKILKVSCQGDEEWNIILGEDDDDFKSITQTSDSGFIAAGRNRISGDNWDFWLAKIDSDFKPNFSSDLHFGYSSLEVNFIDETQIEPTGWNWDFQNDGVIDSNIQNPTYIYNLTGVYDVKLIVERGTRADTLIKANLIVVQESQLLPPQNPLITISGADVILDWDAVTNANHYLIYSSDNPFGEFLFLDYTTIETTYINFGIISEKDKKFYFVIGFDGTMEELTRFINNNQCRSFENVFK